MNSFLSIRVDSSISVIRVPQLLLRLFEENHLPRLHKIPSLKPVEVDPTGE